MRAVDDLLRQLLDRQQIADLVYDYCFYLDAKQPEKLRGLFTADCKVTYSRRAGSFTGIDALIEGLRRILHETYRVTSHHVGPVRLRFEDADTAFGDTCLYAYHVFREPRPDGTVWGRYYDRFVRTPAGWRIAERHLQVTTETHMPTAPAQPAAAPRPLPTPEGGIR